MNMTQSKDMYRLKMIILFFGFISLIYGFLFMVVPGWYLNMIGASPVPFGHIRWPGGVLIALGVGALKFYRNPTKGVIFAYTIAVAPLLGGLSLLYSLLTSEHDGKGFFYAFPGILGIAISLLVIWSLRRVKNEFE